MIYTTNYRKYERNEQVRYSGHRFAENILFALIAVAITTALRYVFLAIDTKAAEDVIPPFIYYSFFGFLLTYIVVSITLMAICLMINPSLIEFFEIKTNRWNLLAMMGIRVSGLAGAKLSVTLFAMWRYYTMGYILSLGVGFVLKFQFVINYLLTIYFVGLFLLFLFIMTAMTLSSFTGNRVLMRLFVIPAIGVDAGLLYYYGLFDSSIDLTSKMSELVQLKSYDSFFVVSAALFFVFYFIMLLVTAKKASAYQWERFGENELDALTSGKETELFVEDGTRHTTVFNTIEMSTMMTPIKDQKIETQKGSAAIVIARIAVFIMILLALGLTFLGYRDDLLSRDEGLFGYRLVTATDAFAVPGMVTGNAILMHKGGENLSENDIVMVTTNDGVQRMASVEAVTDGVYELTATDGKQITVDASGIEYSQAKSSMLNLLITKLVAHQSGFIILVSVSITLIVIEMLLIVLYRKKENDNDDADFIRINY